jgi:hypothetical protein
VSLQSLWNGLKKCCYSKYIYNGPAKNNHTKLMLPALQQPYISSLNLFYTNTELLN